MTQDDMNIKGASLWRYLALTLVNKAEGRVSRSLICDRGGGVVCRCLLAERSSEHAPHRRSPVDGCMERRGLDPETAETRHAYYERSCRQAAV